MKYFPMEIKDPPRIIVNAIHANGDAGLFSHKTPKWLRSITDGLWNRSAEVLFDYLFLPVIE